MGKIKSRFRGYIFYSTSVLSLCIFACWLCFSMHEWWQVSVQKKTYNYVFNGDPWYYESPQRYAKVMLVESLTMLAFLALTTYLIIKKSNLIYLVLIAGLIYSFVTVVYNQTV